MAHYSWDLGINWNSLPESSLQGVDMPYGFVKLLPDNQAGILASSMNQTVVTGDTVTIRFFNITNVIEETPPPSLNLSLGGAQASTILQTEVSSTPFGGMNNFSLDIGEQTTGESAVFGGSLPMWPCQTLTVVNSGWFNLVFEVEVENSSIPETPHPKKHFVADPEMVVGAQSPPIYEKS